MIFSAHSGTCDAVVFHNASFDLRFLRRLYKKVELDVPPLLAEEHENDNVLCTLYLARRLFKLPESGVGASQGSSSPGIEAADASLMTPASSGKSTASRQSFTLRNVAEYLVSTNQLPQEGLSFFAFNYLFISLSLTHSLSQPNSRVSDLNPMPTEQPQQQIPSTEQSPLWYHRALFDACLTSRIFRVMCKQTCAQIGLAYPEQALHPNLLHAMFSLQDGKPTDADRVLQRHRVTSSSPR